LLKNADRVTSASLAQLVNVIAPIMTEPGGPAWRQTTFYPFAITSRLAAGVVLTPHIDVETSPSAQYGAAALVDVAVTWDERESRLAVFAINRSLTDTARITIDMAGLALTRITETALIADGDIHAKNTVAEPDRITAQHLDGASFADGLLIVDLPPVAWAAVELAS
jgi:alpha-N-arabinofuranosidase